MQAAPDDAVYRPLRQQPWPVLFLVARTSGDPNVLAPLLRREIATIDPAIVVSSVNSLDAIVSDGDNARPADRLARQGSPSRVQRAAAVGLLKFAGFVMLKPLHL